MGFVFFVVLYYTLGLYVSSWKEIYCFYVNLWGRAFLVWSVEGGVWSYCVDFATYFGSMSIVGVEKNKIKGSMLHIGARQKQKCRGVALLLPYHPTLSQYTNLNLCTNIGAYPND